MEVSFLPAVNAKKGPGPSLREETPKKLPPPLAVPPDVLR
jgi:hypothetical protein